MITILSPAKTLDFETKCNFSDYTISNFLDESQLLISELKNFSSAELSKMMKLSPKLSDLNFDRYNIPCHYT